MNELANIPILLLWLVGIVISGAFIFVCVLLPFKVYSIAHTLRLILDELRLSRSSALGESYPGTGFEPPVNRGPWIWGTLVGAGLIILAIFLLAYR